ncbi:MAG TPA: SDR family NAD(P)-dependent oxidoreductase [Thermoleophilaceae bacterium]|jgi:short-subunit dehydrogenase
MPITDLTGRTALLTGATGGIGHAIARALHARGAAVKLTARRAEVLEELASELGDRAEVIPADLSSPDEARGLAERAGPVDLLVANAGVPGSGRLEDYTTEQVDRVLHVNLHAPVALAHALLPGMLERGSGHLTFVSSIAGKVASANSSLYSATKFGLRGFGLSLHEDLRGTGVGCTVVFPGFISDAGMWADSGLDLPAGLGPRTPEQVAEGVLRGIETNRAEVDVAGLMQRFGGWLSGPSPGAVAAIMRRSGGDTLSSALAEAQRGKR